MLKKFIKYKKGFTLVELLVALAVSSIVIIGSYLGVNQFSKQQNITSIYLDLSQNARTALAMLKRDIRMAGYYDYTTIHGDIIDKLIISDSGDNCCDKLDVIYDKSSTERIRRTYEVIESNDLKKLVLSEYTCLNNNQCSSINSNWSVVSNQTPLVKDIKNIQFIKKSSGGEALYLWSETEINNSQLYSLSLSTGITEPLFDLPCGAAGEKGTGLTYDKLTKTIFCWKNKKVYKINALTGESLGSFNTVEGNYGSNIIFGNNKIFIWVSNEIYVYSAISGNQEAVYSTEFNYNNNTYQPYSHNGSGQRFAYGNGDLYIWFDQQWLATFNAENGTFKNMINTLQTYSVVESVSGSSANSRCEYSLLHYDNGLHIFGSNSGNNGKPFINSSSIGKFQPKDCGSEDGCQGSVGLQCGTSLAKGKNNILYIWHGDEVYPFTGANNGLSCDTVVSKYKDCKSPGILTLRASVYPDPGSNYRRDISPSRGSNMIYIEDTSDPNTYSTNIQIDITFLKSIGINKSVEKIYTGSATVRNF